MKKYCGHRWRPFLVLICMVLFSNCKSNVDSGKLFDYESDCVKRFDSIIKQTELISYQGALTKINPWVPNWNRAYMDSTENYTDGLFLELETADTSIHVNVTCQNRRDEYCTHNIWICPRLDNFDYINYFENVASDLSFLGNCGHTIHGHSHKTETSILTMNGASLSRGLWQLDSASVENPIFNYLWIDARISGVIKSRSSVSGYREIDLAYNQLGTALNHTDTADFILHCLIQTCDKLILENRLDPENPEQFYFSRKKN